MGLDFVNAAFLALGTAASVTLFLLGKIKCRATGRFFIDFFAALGFCLFFYLLCFLLRDGAIGFGDVVCAFVGFALPWLFLPLNAPSKE